MASTHSDMDTETSDASSDSERTASSWEPQDFDEHESLQQDIAPLIAEYQDFTRKPPFNAGELIVLACITLEQATKTEILEWILQNFKYYCHRAIRVYVATQSGYDDEDGPQPAQVIPGFRDAFNLWFVPLRPAEEEEAKTVLYTKSDEDEIEMTVPPRAGRVFLRHWLEEERKGTFPFLDLPAELRNRVYEMLFTFPAESGITVLEGCEMYLLNRPEDEKIRVPDDIESHEEHALRLDMKRDRILDLLRANKQVFQEGMPYFYSLNRFRCDNFSATVKFLRRIGRDRMKHLRELGISLDHGGDAALRRFPSAMANFTSGVGKLKRLEVNVGASTWLRMHAHCRRLLGRERKFTGFGQIPGFKDLALACSKAGILEWDGAQHRAIKGWVEGEMEKMEKVAEQVGSKEAGGKKRKAMGGKGGTKQVGGVTQDGEKPKRKARRVVLPRRTDSDGENDD